MAKIRNEILILDANSSAITDTSYTTRNRNFYWDESKYTGATIYLEVYWKVNSSANTGSIQLYNNTDSAVVAGSELTTNSETLVRTRSGAITLTTLKDYSPQVKVTAGTVTIQGARIIIIQEAEEITNVETQLLVNPSVSVTVATYGNTYNKNFKYDAIKYNGTIQFFLEAWLYTASAVVTSYVRLYDLTTSSAVADSELSVTGTTKTRVRSSALTLIDGHEYRLQMRTGTGGAPAISVCPRLIIQQTNPTKTRVLIDLSGESVLDNTDAWIDAYFTTYHDSSEYSVERSVIGLQARVPGNTGNARLYDITNSAVITNSQVTDDLTYAILESSNLVLTNQTLLRSQFASTDGSTAELQLSRLVYDFDWSVVTVEAGEPTTLPSRSNKKQKRYLFLIDGDNGAQKEATEKWDFDSITREINGTMAVSIKTNKTLDSLLDANLALNDAVTIRCSTAETGSNGLDYFSGYINQQNIDINDKGETINLACLGHISKLYQAIWRNGTTIVQNYTASGADPETIIKAIIDNYRTLDSNMRVNYSTTSTEAVGTTVKDKFELVTFGNALERVVNLAYTASRIWFYRVLGDNIFTFKKASLSADHLFTLGKDISNLSIAQDLNNSIDEVFLYYNNTALRRYKNTSNITSYGYRSKQLRETNVPDTTTADSIGNSTLVAFAPPVLKINLRINNTYANGIEFINPGDTCQILNTPTAVVNLLTTNMLITKTTYYKDYVDCELTITHPRVENEIDNIRKSFAKSQTEGMPVTTYTDV